MPLVSVIIPTYNSARYVAAAVDSVLEQTFDDFEVLVIDDGSTDNTREVLARYGTPVRYVYQPNGGVATARNAGIRESAGQYVAFLDADDAFFPEKLARQVGALASRPGAGLCYTGARHVDDDLRPLKDQVPHPRRPELEDLLFFGNVVGSPSSVVAEKALFGRVGGFDPELSQCADWDMWVRLARVVDFVAIEEPLINYRQHATNMSRNVPLLERDSIRVLEKGFQAPDTPQRMRARASRAFGRNWMVLAGSYFHAGRYRDWARCTINALRLDPSQSRRLLGYPFRKFARLSVSCW